MLQKLVKWVQDGNKPKQASEGGGLEVHSLSGDAAAGADKKETAPPGPAAITDTPTKMASARCDLHPLFVLKETAIDIGPPQPQTKKIKALRCSKPDCTRHYFIESGYRNVAPAEAAVAEEPEGKTSCNLNHPARGMVLTKLHGTFVWACPESGCAATVPYEEVKPPQPVHAAEPEPAPAG